MKKWVCVALILAVLLFALSIQTFAEEADSSKAELSTSVYYDFDLKNADFAFLGGLGISVLGSSPLNQNLRLYYGISSGFTGLGLTSLAELGIGKKFNINSGFTIEPMVLIDGGVNLFLKDGSPSPAGGASGLIRFNKILNDKLNLHFTTGVKYLYLAQSYQYLLIPLEAGLVFKF